MNCPDCRDLLQQWLDARTRAAAAVPGEPPGLCPVCTQWAVAARRFDRGLRLLAPDPPPPHLASRIVAGVAAERRRRRWRWLLAAGTVAAAATLLFVVWQSLHRDGPAPTLAPKVIAQAPQPLPVSPPSLGDSVAEAGSAVASLTSRTADETVAKTRILLPVAADPSLAQLDLPPTLDPPTQSLRQTGEGVSAGLEPVADSARRAVGLFLRELPPMDGPPRTGF